MFLHVLTLTIGGHKVKSKLFVFTFLCRYMKVVNSIHCYISEEKMIMNFENIYSSWNGNKVEKVEKNAWSFKIYLNSCFHL